MNMKQLRRANGYKPQTIIPFFVDGRPATHMGICVDLSEFDTMTDAVNAEEVPAYEVPLSEGNNYWFSEAGAKFSKLDGELFDVMRERDGILFSKVFLIRESILKIGK